MGKTSKIIFLIAIIILAGLLLRDLFSKQQEQVSPKIYQEKLKPVSFPEKQFPKYDQDTNDPAVKYTRLWKISELYSQSSEACLKTFADQHPNKLVQNQNLTSLYNIEIGTPRWVGLTTAFEKYASEVCYSFSGKEMENEYARSVRENLNDDEILKLLEFFNTDLGEKLLYAGDKANQRLLEVISQKQRDASNKELEIYYKKIEELQNIK
jgi:hypothetical protein